MKIRLLAEWEQQDAILLAWPHVHSDWQHQLAAIEKNYIEICQQIFPVAKIVIFCYDQAHQQHIAGLFSDLTPIIFIECKTNDTWVRDYGPLFCQQGEQLIAHNFAFNAWGGKYAHDLDNAACQVLQKKMLLDYLHHDFILEGGSIETDGAGTLLTTAQCLLDINRNANLNQQKIENYLTQQLGLHHFLWLTEGTLVGDDTDAHIDNLARFIDKHRICYVQCNDEKDPHYVSLQCMQRQLAGFTDQQGMPYELLPLPLPAPIYNQKNERLPASYLNFLIVNQLILFPIYQVNTDNQAIELMQQYCPQYTVIPVDCLPLVQQYGSLHCGTIGLARGSIQQ